MNIPPVLNNNWAQFDTNWFIGFQAYAPYIGVYYLIVYISLLILIIKLISLVRFKKIILAFDRRILKEDYILYSIGVEQK